MRSYRAFGLAIASEFAIAQIPEASVRQYDVRIIRAELPDIPRDATLLTVRPGELRFGYPQVGAFRITGGSLIEVDPDEACSKSHLGVFLMGSCMGAVLHQRGLMPLHGSCVTDGSRSVLITGASGAGKSTLAAEFIKRGWKLLTDDVSAVEDVEGTPTVRSSYPSQKLWQDALERYERPDSQIHSLYFNENREKFGVDVRRYFHEGSAPLSLVVRLIPADEGCSLSPIEGMARVDQLMRNTYRSYMISPVERQRHFQRCVTLSTKIPMALAIRENGRHCAPELYERITNFMEEYHHD